MISFSFKIIKLDCLNIASMVKPFYYLFGFYICFLLIPVIEVVSTLQGGCVTEELFTSNVKQFGVWFCLNQLFSLCFILKFTVVRLINDDEDCAFLSYISCTTQNTLRRILPLFKLEVVQEKVWFSKLWATHHEFILLHINNPTSQVPPPISKCLKNT